MLSEWMKATRLFAGRAAASIRRYSLLRPGSQICRQETEMGLGFRVSGLGFRVSGLGFRV